MKRVFHATSRANADKILTEGLKPLVSNRPKELAVVDFAFDKIAERLGINYRRSGIFAWPDKKLNVFGDTVILELIVDPELSVVIHQAWVDLAWGIVGTVFSRIGETKRGFVETATPEELFGMFRNVLVYEGRVGHVLFELARNYWSSAVTLAQYNTVSKEQMNRDVVGMIQRFPGLLPHLEHEVCLGVDIIENERIIRLK